MSRIRERRPTRSPSSQFSRALRTTAWRAALGVKPSSRSEPISASCHAPSGRGSRNSPSTVSSVERAAGAPTERRRRTSSTGGTLACGAMTDLALVGGTVADVYTGTWIQANVEIADGVITYVGPREPAADAVDRRHRQGAGARATSSRTPTRGACTRRPRCSRPRSPTARRRSSTTACSSSSPTASTGLRADRRPDALRARPRLLDRADLAAVRLPRRGRRASRPT